MKEIWIDNYSIREERPHVYCISKNGTPCQYFNSPIDLSPIEMKKELIKFINGTTVFFDTDAYFLRDMKERVYMAKEENTPAFFGTGDVARLLSIMDKKDKVLHSIINYINSESPDAGVSGKHIKDIIRGELDE